MPHSVEGGLVQASFSFSDPIKVIPIPAQDRGDIVVRILLRNIEPRECQRVRVLLHWRMTAGKSVSVAGGTHLGAKKRGVSAPWIRKNVACCSEMTFDDKL